MKKIVRMSESDRQAFLNFVEATKNHEKDKDLFLDAARLERTECNTRLTNQQKYSLISGTLIGAGIILGILAFFSPFIISTICR